MVAKNGDHVIKFDLAPLNQSLLVSAFAAGFGQGKELLACLQVMTGGGGGWSRAVSGAAISGEPSAHEPLAL